MKTKKIIIIFIFFIIVVALILNVHRFLPVTTQDNTISDNKASAENTSQNTQNSAVNQNTEYVKPIFTNQNLNTNPTAQNLSTQNSATTYSNNLQTPKLNFDTAFFEDFATSYSVIEADKMADRTSPGWWLGSGAYFNSENGVGSTVIGPLALNDPFRIEYASSNPLDTDGGYYPQNIFRLVLTRGKWLNFEQEADFKIVNNNLSSSPNRNNSNGLLFFNRYQDADNLYYTGIRVDGMAVIKKKIRGTYYELSGNQFYKNSTYNHESNPNLIPLNKWIGLRTEIITNLDNTVSIKLFIDKDMTGNWVLATQAKDDGVSYGGSAILDEGYTGIRTDFMDVLFDNYKIARLE